MKVFDYDGTGTLDFSEFVQMFCTSDEFKFKASPSSSLFLSSGLILPEQS